MADYVNLIAAMLAFISALIGLTGYIRFQSRRDRLVEVGDSFRSVAAGLGSDQLITRITSAGLLTRFFDKDSEYSTGELPYATDAIQLAAAVLKTEPTGVVQKLLADDLAKAPTLANTDFQKANLRNCYWGSRSNDRRVDISGADFFRADMSEASLRRSIAVGAAFKQAHLVKTVFVDADLRESDFSSANLKGATFHGSLLCGASFAGATHIPEAIATKLDQRGQYTSNSPVQRTLILDSSDAPEVRVFVSRPSQCDRNAQVVFTEVVRGLEAAGAESVTFLSNEYGTSAPLDEIKRRISECAAVVILGVPSLRISHATWREGTPQQRILNGIQLATPWSHVEAGVAAALDKPILILRDDVTEGVFDIGEQPHTVTVIDLNGNESIVGLRESLASWLTRLNSVD